MRDIVLIAHNLRSNHNVGSLLRTAEGLGVSKVLLTGYTPYPASDTDTRMPHIARKVASAIHKTALGAESSQPWEHNPDIAQVLSQLRESNYSIYALEQHADSVALPSWTPPERIAIIVGREVEGVEPEIIEQCDGCIEIPMQGQKESFNVAQAAAMTMYHCRYVDS